MFVYKEDIVFLFFGGIFSILLPSVIVYSKRELLRINKKKELQEENPEVYGDLDAFLDDSVHYKRINFLDHIIEQAIQPLFIICLFEVFKQNETEEVLLLVCLVIVMFLHELFAAEIYAGKRIYRIFIVILWIVAFTTYSYEHMPKSGPVKSNSSIRH